MTDEQIQRIEISNSALRNNIHKTNELLEKLITALNKLSDNTDTR